MTTLNMEVTPELAEFLVSLSDEPVIGKPSLGVQAAFAVLKCRHRVAEIEAEMATRTRQRDIALDAVKAILHHNCRDIDHAREIANRAMGKIRKS